MKLSASCGLRHRYFLCTKYFVLIISQSSWLNRTVTSCAGYTQVAKEDAQVQDRITIDDYLTVFGARGEFSDVQLSPQLDQKLYELGERWASNALS